MTARSTLLCCLALAASIPTVGSAFSRTDRMQTDDLEARIVALEGVVSEQAVQLVEARTQIQALVAVVTDEVVQLGEASTQIEALLAFQAAVVEGTQELATAVQSSRKGGFEWAGPNPQSKTDLLESLFTFGRRVRGEPDPEDQAESKDPNNPVRDRQEKQRTP